MRVADYGGQRDHIRYLIDLDGDPGPGFAQHRADQFARLDALGPGGRELTTDLPGDHLGKQRQTLIAAKDGNPGLGIPGSPQGGGHLAVP